MGFNLRNSKRLQVIYVKVSKVLALKLEIKELLLFALRHYLVSVSEVAKRLIGLKDLLPQHNGG